MPVINKFPRLEVIVNDLSKRITILERSKRYGAMAVASWPRLPGVDPTLGFPQSGDIAFDVQTGALWLFGLTVNTSLSAAVTYAGAAVNLTVAERTGIVPGQLLTVGVFPSGYGSTASSCYAYQVSSAYTATTGAGAVSGQFIALTYPLTGFGNVPLQCPFTGGATNWDLPTNPTTVPAGALVYASNWRQMVAAYDLIARPTTFTGASGANATVAGGNLGGTGQVPARGYKPVR